MTTVMYVIILGFNTSDACWDFVHSHDMWPAPTETVTMCEMVETEPRATIRPRSRPSKE